MKQTLVKDTVIYGTVILLLFLQDVTCYTMDRSVNEYWIKGVNLCVLFICQIFIHWY